MARKTQRKTRRALDPAKLPYAEETQAANEVIDFLFNRLPGFIARELHDIDIAVTEANLFRELSSLSDESLARAGLKRSDLAALVASTFHLINLAERRKGRRARPVARTRAPTAKRKLAKRSTAKRKNPRALRA